MNGITCKLINNEGFVKTINIQHYLPIIKIPVVYKCEIKENKDIPQKEENNEIKFYFSKWEESIAVYKEKTI